jgi:PPE-repeat protein
MGPPKAPTLPLGSEGRLVLDFGVLPPEINSARMYSGPGSAPMLAAAGAWDALAEELSVAAAGYGSVVTELTSGPWLGPSSVAMAEAAAPYVAWLHATAVQAEDTAAQAKEAAAAYELAFATTVPPPVIAANRSLLMSLMSTNFFGQNTPAIAATETHYAEMWIQDAVAMYGYAESSAAASIVVPFSEPQPTTEPTGLTTQSATVAHAAASSAGTQQSALSQLISATPSPLQQLAAPTAAPDALLTPQALITIGLTPPRFVNMALGSSSAATSQRGITITNERLTFQAERDLEKGLKFTGNVASGRPGGSLVSAGLGRATPVGSLSVPPSWASAAPEIRPVALALPDSGAGVTAEAAGNMPQVPGSSFSQAILGTLSREVPPPRQPKTRPIIVRSPAAG